MLFFFACSSIDDVQLSQDYERALLQIGTQSEQSDTKTSIEICNQIKNNFYRVDCLYFAVEHFAKEGLFEKSRTICAVVKNSKQNSECLFRLAEYSMDSKDCQHLYQSDCQIHIFSKKIFTDQSLSKDDILSLIPRNTDLNHYWTAAYRRILQLEPQTNCAEEEEKKYCMNAAEGLYLDNWRQDKEICYKLQRNKLPPSPQLTSTHRNEMISKFRTEVENLGRCR